MDDANEIVTPEWIRQRWGGHTYREIDAHFMLDITHGNLWLHCENNCENAVSVSRVMLRESPKRQDVIDAERMFRVLREGQ